MTTATEPTDLKMTAKDGAGVQEIVAKLEEIKRTKQDYIVPSKDMKVVVLEGADAPQLAVTSPIGGDVAYNIRRIAHEQLAEKTQIPPQYARRMLEQAPELYAANINPWMGDGNKNHLVRVLGNDVRAILSDRFRALDSYDLFFETYPVLKDAGAAITRVDLTDEHFYLRALVRDWEERIDNWEVGRPNLDGGRGGHNWHKTNADDAETVVPGILISNSDVGRGGLRAEVFFWFGQCDNGLVLDRSIYKVHTGRQLADIGLLSDETRQLEDQLVWAQVRDVVKATFDRDEFRRLLATVKGTVEVELQHPVQAVDAVVQHYGFSDAARQSILDELISPKTRSIDPGLNVYGLVQAVTAQAHKSDNIEDALVYQRAGGELITGKAQEIIANFQERELVPATPRTLAARKAAATRRANRNN